MQVKCCTSVVSILQSVNKAFRLFLSKLDVITAASPLPAAICFWLFSCLAALTPGYFFLAALTSELVCDGCWANGMKESCFTGGWNEMRIPRVTNYTYNRGFLTCLLDRQVSRQTVPRQFFYFTCMVTQHFQSEKRKVRTSASIRKKEEREREHFLKAFPEHKKMDEAPPSQSNQYLFLDWMRAM